MRFFIAFLLAIIVGVSQITDLAKNLGVDSLYLIPEEQKSIHFVNSVPSHNEFFTSFPVNVVINFDTPLTKQSSSVTYKDKEIDKSSRIDEAGKTLRVEIEPTSKNGIYLVSYEVCFTDGICSEGQFAYKIDGAKIIQFSNQTGSFEIRIKISNDPDAPNGISLNCVGRFAQNCFNVLVNSGTTVTWVNGGNTTISIKSEPVDFNSYYTLMNSEDLSVEESFSILFNSPGEYRYYLSSNPKIRGRILVQKRVGF